MLNKNISILKTALFSCALVSVASAETMMKPHCGCPNFRTGFYVGPQIGVDFVHANFDTSISVTPVSQPLDKKSSKNKAGLIYGASLGYRYVHRNLVGGLNLDFDFMNSKLKRNLNFNQIGDDIVYARLKRKFTFNPSLLLGAIVHPKCMIFTQFGMMLSQYELRSYYPEGRTTHKKNKSIVGFTAGLGTEYALNHKWSLKGSVNYQGAKTMRTNFRGIVNANANDSETNRIETKSAVLKFAAIYKI